jgi:hypothetical protein
MNNLINPFIFPNCCTLHNDSILYVKDGNNSSCFLSNENDFHIKVTNNVEKLISFLKIDKCIFNDGDESKCDLSLADAEKIYFIEIKELETNDLYDLKHTKRNKKRREAKEQLASTINEFKKTKGLKNLTKVNAVIALISKLDKNYSRIISTKDQGVIDDFMDLCGCPNIYEGNLIEF